MINDLGQTPDERSERLETILLENRALMKSLGRKIVFWLMIIAFLLAVILHYVTR